MMASEKGRNVQRDVNYVIYPNAATEMRMAMKNATDNAEEMATKYTQLYNRTRQGAITQEILEVIGGAEVLN